MDRGKGEEVKKVEKERGRERVGNRAGKDRERGEGNGERIRKSKVGDI